MKTVYDFEALQIDGKPISLSNFKGRVLLIVNTASACGFTPQFAGLEVLHETYGKKGLVVLCANLSQNRIAELWEYVGQAQADEPCLL